MANQPMKQLVLFTLVCVIAFSSTNTIAQKVNNVVSSNGYSYGVGDTITLGVGSSPDGNFNYIYTSIATTALGALAIDPEYDIRLPEFFHGATVVIEKIRIRDADTLLFFDTDGWGGFAIDLEKAIQVCEVSFCRDNGFLTQEEFEKLILLYRAVLDSTISAQKFHELRREMLGL